MPVSRASSRQTRGVNHKALLKQVTGYLDTTRGWYVKIGAGPYQKPGLPDIIAALPPAGLPKAEYRMHAAEFVAIELKTGTATLTARQEEERQRITAACGHYWVIHTVDDLEDALLVAGLIEQRSLMRFKGTGT